MIKRVYHFADIHIPNSEESRPFMDMMKLCLAELLQETKQFEKDEIRIVLAGDIFHNKVKANNEAKKTFHEMLNYLNEIGKTILIAGNHDMLENNHDKLDSITPTFEIKNVYPNVIFADRELDYKSGYIIDDNIIWVVYSMYDGFVKPNIDGLREKYPDYRIVGLYHGDIPGATTDSGRVSEVGVDMSIFSECDCVMAGHIHKHQELKQRGVPVVYAGSVFQHNVGENTTGHGFVIWDMENMTYQLKEVTNNYKIYKFKINSYDDVKNDVEKLINL